MKAENIALVFSGGGARGAYQAGAVRALAEILPGTRSPFRIINGTSAGAINACYIAAHVDRWSEAADKLAKIWLALELEDIYNTSSLSLSTIALAWISRIAMGGQAGTGKRANYLLSTKPLFKLLSSNIDFAAIRRHVHTGHLHGVSFETVQYFNGASIAFFEGHAGIQDWSRSHRFGQRTALNVCHVMASAAIPMFFPPVKIGPSYYGDGTLRQTAPLSPAIHMGADRILSIGIRPLYVNPPPPETVGKPPAFAEIAGEMLNALFLDSMDSDVERLSRVNDTITRLGPHVQAHSFALREIPILQLRPSRSLTELIPPLLQYFPTTLRYFFKGMGVSDRDAQGQELISYLAFLKECITPILELGYQDTQARRDEILAFMRTK